MQKISNEYLWTHIIWYKEKRRMEEKINYSAFSIIKEKSFGTVRKCIKCYAASSRHKNTTFRLVK